MNRRNEKQGLEALLKALAEKQLQSSAKTPVSSSTHSAKGKSASIRREQWIKHIAVEQINREPWEVRRRYRYPPVIPEDIVQSINTGVSRGVLELDSDPIAASLADANEIRKMIDMGRMDASELPLLKYRIDKILGLTKREHPPDGREMLSSLAYYYRGSIEKLNQIRADALADMMDDYQRSLITKEELERYQQELNEIIDQYLPAQGK